MRHIRAELERVSRRDRAAGFDRVIGTSGTILSLGAIAAAQEAAAPPRRCATGGSRQAAAPGPQASSSAIDIERAAARSRPRAAARRPRRGRRRAAGHDRQAPRRDRDHAVRSVAARRAGPRLHRARTASRSPRPSGIPDVRRRSVIELAERCSYCAGPRAAGRPARASLFDQTRSDARARPTASASGSSTRRCCTTSATHISYERHHKHSYYLIKNGDLRGFEPDEIEIDGARRAVPPAGDAEESHDGVRRRCQPARRRVVRTLAAMLRLAESLDRSHAQSDQRRRAARPRRRRLLQVRDVRRCGAGAVGRRPPRRAASSGARQAAPDRSQRTHPC